MTDKGEASEGKSEGEMTGDSERQTVLNLFKPRDFRITFGN